MFDMDPFGDKKVPGTRGIVWTAYRAIARSSGPRTASPRSMDRATRWISDGLPTLGTPQGAPLHRLANENIVNTFEQIIIRTGYVVNT